MDLLEQPVDAVAFHLYSLPEVAAAGAAAWTCLAAVLAAAAAAGLWRLRSSAPAAVTSTVKPLGLHPSPGPMSPEPERSSEIPRESTSSPRERYTAYYYDSDCIGCCYVEGDDDDDVEEQDQDPGDDDGVRELPSPETDPFEWEVVRPLPLVAMTAAETPRYRNNPTALGGSVVRLWDQVAAEGCLSAAASPRRRGRVGIVSSF